MPFSSVPVMSVLSVSDTLLDEVFLHASVLSFGNCKFFCSELWEIVRVVDCVGFRMKLIQDRFPMLGACRGISHADVLR